MMETNTQGSNMSKSLPVQVQLMTVFAGLFLSAVATQGQVSKGDFSSVAAAGKVNGDTYQNSYFGIMLSAPKAHWEVRGPISVQRRQARLIDAVYDSGVPERGPEENYTLALLVESQENFPKGTTIEQYVRNLRHQAEGDNVKIYREEFPLTVQGVSFVGTVFRFSERPNFGYYRAFYSTVLNEYFVTIEVQCGGEERLQKLLSSAVKITPKSKQ
jgi:hypothetical protein